MSTSKRHRQSSEGEAGPTLKKCKFTRVRGNTIYCSQRDQWDTVTAIKVRTEEAASPFKLTALHREFTFSFEPHFVIPTDFFPLSAVSRENDRAAKIRCEAMSWLPFENCLRLTPIASSKGQPAVSANDSESGDEAPPDFPIPEAFTDEALGCLRGKYAELHRYFHEAIDVHFHNAQGKCFIQAFLDFLLPHDFASRLSTSPNGDHQPGAFEVTWVVKNKTQHAAASSEKCDRQERVADVVAYHATKHYFAVVVEIKSDFTQSRAHHFEQMVGLFHPQQAVLVVAVSRNSLDYGGNCPREL